MPVPFCVALAGQVIGISALYGETRDFCRDYLTDASPSFLVEITPADIAFEREKSDREAVVEGLVPSAYSDEYLETLAVYRKIAAGLLDKDTLLFHGSAIAVDGEAYLFTAKSGTGKSTHTRLWRQVFGPRAVMVNDDKPLLKIAESGVTVYGTPWDGKHRLSSNIAVPLKAICILERGERNEIRRITPEEAYPMLLQQTNKPRDAQRMRKTLQLLDILKESVSLYRLRCNREPEAAQIAYEGMQEKEG